jgi:hypothetical protein
MGRILQQFGSPVNDAFGKQENVAPTPTEIEAFKAKMRDGMQRMTSDAEKRANDMRKQLNELEADSPERPKLEVRVAQAEQMAASLKAAATQRADVSDTMAVAFVNASKIEKALYRKYGGRVIFQQAGPEAIDARRTLYEAAEKSGDLTFADPGVRHLFYYYYTQMRHTPLNQKTIDKWLAGDL